MIKKTFVVLLTLIIFFSLNSCGVKFSKSQYYATDYKTGGIDKKSGIGFEFPEKYNIDVFFENDDNKPPMGYELVKEISISGDRPLTQEELSSGRMLITGNSEKMKRELLQQLIEKTLNLGGNALVDVKYSTFTSANSTGFILSGKAVRYQITE